jgi:hypothetical protein
VTDEVNAAIEVQHAGVEDDVVEVRILWQSAIGGGKVASPLLIALNDALLGRSAGQTLAQRDVGDTEVKRRHDAHM